MKNLNQAYWPNNAFHSELTENYRIDFSFSQFGQSNQMIYRALSNFQTSNNLKSV